MGPRRGMPRSPCTDSRSDSVGWAKRVSGAAMMYASCVPGAAAVNLVAAATCASITSSSCVYAHTTNVRGSAAVGAGHGSVCHSSRLTMLVNRRLTKLVLNAVRAAVSRTCSPTSLESP